MSETNTRLYEGLFLFNAATVGSNTQQAIDIVKQYVDRAGGEIVTISKWDDRKLAYKLDGQKRGLFILAYFNVDAAQVAHIERDVTFSDDVLRCLIIRADHIGETELDTARENEKNTAAAIALESEGEGAGEGESDEQAEGEAQSATAVAESDDDADSDSDSDDDAKEDK